MMRTAIVGIFLVIYALVVGLPLVLFSWLAGSVGGLYRAALAGVMFILRAVGVKVRAEGVGNIPPGPCVFVANHTSNADPPAVASSIPRRISILPKKSLFRIPILGWAFRLARFVPVDRSNRDAAIASVEKATEYLREGVSFLIYAEGTRSPDGRLAPFKKGAAVMAINAGVPLVPISVVGAHLIMRKGELSLHAGEIVVKFGVPIDASQYTLEQRGELIGRAHAAVAAGLPRNQQPGV